MLKKLPILFTAVFVLCTIFFAGCERKVKLYESGYYVYELYTDKTTGETVAYIADLTETGKLQETLIIPAYLDGYKVTQLNYKYGLGVGGKFESENLNRIYITTDITSPQAAFQNCPNLEKVILMCDDAYIMNAPDTKYMKALGGTVSSDFSANISYMLNYYETEAEDSFWADDYDYGEKIKYLPPEPERAGFLFDGWYKEPECINEWNFENDTLPESRYDENNDLIYQETKLYAKWAETN